MVDAPQRGRPPLDKAKREREHRRAALHKGMLACYEVIDMARKELGELDAADKGLTAGGEKWGGNAWQ